MNSIFHFLGFSISNLSLGILHRLCHHPVRHPVNPGQLRILPSLHLLERKTGSPQQFLTQDPDPDQEKCQKKLVSDKLKSQFWHDFEFPLHSLRQDQPDPLLERRHLLRLLGAPQHSLAHHQLWSRIFCGMKLPLLINFNTSEFSFSEWRRNGESFWSLSPDRNEHHRH